MEGKAIVAIERAKQIISQIEHFVKETPLDSLPGSFTFQILKLEEHSSLLKGCFDMGVCADIIGDAVGGMNWKILADLEGGTDAEKWALYNTIVNFSKIAKAGEPQQKEAQSGQKSLDEALEFVPDEHKEAAKSVFKRLLDDGTIKASKSGFKWLKKPINGLVWYLAANANECWKLKKSNGNYDWKVFADLFGIDAARLIEWQNKTQWGKEEKGIRNLPNGFEYIEELFP